MAYIAMMPVVHIPTKSVTLAEGVQAWEKNIKDYASQQGYTVK